MTKRTPRTLAETSPERGWTKAISPARDRLQSLLLAWTLGPILLALTLQGFLYALRAPNPIRVLFAEDLVLSLVFALAVWALKAATAPAALSGGLICLLITFYTGSPTQGPLHSGLTPLIELFLFTFAATRAGRLRKQRAALAEPHLTESRRGRSASQILANLGAAALLSSAAGALLLDALIQLTHRFLFIPLALPVLVLAALVEATADTVSSEIGQAFGGPPILFTTLKPVPPGTDGAVTPIGTGAGVLTSALVAAVAVWAMRLPAASALTAFFAGVFGLFFDSLLGATVERKGWLGNDLVNFTSTLFAVALALLYLVLNAPTPA